MYRKSYPQIEINVPLVGGQSRGALCLAACFALADVQLDAGLCRAHASTHDTPHLQLRQLTSLKEAKETQDKPG
jgi:hypothetical protein